MTLLENERLARKLVELLQEGGSPELAAKLAGDYAAVCHAANLRLQQCEAMIRAGDRPQAIQLAETPPKLLELVVLLDFPEVDEWRSYCQKNSLAVPDRIESRPVKTLRECYAQGITTDHPLYTAYRGAVMQRNDEEALKILQSITRLNAADTNAAAELARLDAKVLAARLQHLGASLETAEPALLVAEIEAVEAFGFKAKPDGEIWRKAQVVRCGCLLAEAAKLKDTGRWPDALARIELLRRLEQELKLELAPALLKQLGIVETWAQAEQAKDKKEREFQLLLGQLQQKIQQSEEKDTSSRYVELPEMRDDYEGLHKIWRALTDFTRPIPEVAAASFRKRSGLLEGEMARRIAIRRRIIVAVSAAVLAVLGLTAWLVTGELKARSFTRELQTAMDQRQVRAADKLLDQAHTEKIGDVRVVAAAETFSAGEHARLDDFEAAFKQLPAQLAGGPDAARLAALAGQLAQVRSALDALAPDLKTENEPRLQAYETQWQDYLAAGGQVVNGLLEQWVTAAEKAADELDYRAPLDKTSRQLDGLAGAIQKLQDCEAGYGEILPLRTDLRQRSASVIEKYTAYRGELGKLAAGLAALQKARTIAEFSGGIKQITSSEFTAAPAALAARTIAALVPDEETVLRSLLQATNPATWAYIQKPGPVSFIPEVVMPAERQMFASFLQDPAVNAHHQHYRFWLDAAGTSQVDWITVDVLEAATGWKQIKAWPMEADATSAYFMRQDYGWFGGQFKLSPTQPMFNLQLVGPRDEAAAFYSVGLENVLAGEAYAKPLLVVLDAIKDSREGSPLFRAWLFLRLVELMKFQPDAWGLTFCPAARLHAAQIEIIVGGSLNSGDWFVPGKVKADSRKLDQFFESIKSVSSAKQAVGRLMLVRAAVRNGLQYAGFAGLDGRPCYVDTPLAGEVWGYEAQNKQLVLLAAKINPNQPFKMPALPLSPLFTPGRPAAEFLANAGVDPADASFQSALPPLFQVPSPP